MPKRSGKPGDGDRIQRRETQSRNQRPGNHSRERLERRASARCPPLPRHSLPARRGAPKSDAETRLRMPGPRSAPTRKTRASWTPSQPRSIPAARHRSRSILPPLFPLPDRERRRQRKAKSRELWPALAMKMKPTIARILPPTISPPPETADGAWPMPATQGAAPPRRGKMAVADEPPSTPPSPSTRRRRHPRKNSAGSRRSRSNLPANLLSNLSPVLITRTIMRTLARTRTGPYLCNQQIVCRDH